MFNHYNTKVTAELHELIDAGFDIFNFEFPYYAHTVAGVTHDVEKFKKKFVDHFYFRQIGYETPQRFRHHLRTHLNEIMPYYVQLQKSVELFESVGDPLESYNLTETYERSASHNEKNTGTASDTTTTERSGTSSSEKTGDTSSEKHASNTNSTNNENTKKFSNTPQGELGNLDSYLTEATIDNGSSSDTSETSESEQFNASENVQANTSENGEVETLRNTEDNTEGGETESYTMTRRGNIGVANLGDEIQRIRSSYINIDALILSECECLFLGIY